MKDTESAIFKSYSYVDVNGVNVVKIPILPWYFDTGAPREGVTLKERLLADLSSWKELIAWALSKNIYVLIEVGLFTSWPKENNWPEDGRSLWKDASAQQEYIEAVDAIVSVYRGVQGVIIDPQGEPHGATADEVANNHEVPRLVWNDLYKRVIDSIRLIDPDMPIEIQPIWGMPNYFQYLTVHPDKKTMYAYHPYAPHDFTHQALGANIVYPGISADGVYEVSKYWDKEALLSFMKPAADFGINNSVRMVVSEFGCARTAPAASRLAWTIDMVDIIENYGHDWIVFRYEGWGVGVDYREGWAIENSEIESVLLPKFKENLV